MKLEQLSLIILLLIIVIASIRPCEKLNSGTNSKIPPNIILTWKNNKVSQRVFNKWKELNPDKNILFFNDDDIVEFLQTHYGNKYVDFFKKIKHGAIKGDFFRLCYLYKKGGYYNDIDIDPVLPISDYIKDDTDFFTVLNVPPNINTVYQAILYSIPYNPILKNAIDHMLEHGHDFKSGISTFDKDFKCGAVPTSCLKYEMERFIGKKLQKGITRTPTMTFQIGYMITINRKKWKYNIKYNKQLIAHPKQCDLRWMYPWWTNICINCLNNRENIENPVFETTESGNMKQYDECVFKIKGTHEDDWEIVDCSIILQVIPLVKHGVLELGGGTGKISHKINEILQKRGLGTQHLVLEPDDPTMKNYWKRDKISPILEYNRNLYRDQYTISKKYAQNLTMEDLQIFNYPPDCLIVDCEGCLKEFFPTKVGQYILNTVKWIVNEMDGNNEYIHKTLKDNNFIKVGEISPKLQRPNNYGATEVWMSTTK